MSVQPIQTNDEDENQFEEPEDACLRRELGLRPTHYLEHSASQKDPHPDTRPCPSWCWIGQEGDDFVHEVNWEHPLSAMHTMGATPSVVASLYPGSFGSGSPRCIHSATLEPYWCRSDRARP